MNPTLKVIVHIDMDMFYAAVEMRDQPTLREKPMAVGTMAMLTTSNYKVFIIILDIDFIAEMGRLKPLQSEGSQIWSSSSDARFHCEEALPKSDDSAAKHGQVRCGGEEGEEGGG